VNQYLIPDALEEVVFFKSGPLSRMRVCRVGGFCQTRVYCWSAEISCCVSTSKTEAFQCLESLKKMCRCWMCRGVWVCSPVRRSPVALMLSPSTMFVDHDTKRRRRSYTIWKPDRARQQNTEEKDYQLSGTP